MLVPQVVTVFGAAGVQGGSVARALHALPAFDVRAVVKDLTYPATKDLQSLGIPVILADRDDPESCIRACDGAYAVFATTNSADRSGPGPSKAREIQQGKNIADAAKKAGVKHYIWSSLPGVSKDTGGKITTSESFDAKAEIEGYVEEIGLPATMVYIGNYMSGMARKQLQRAEDGTFLPLKTPIRLDLPCAHIDAERDFGRLIAGILADPTRFIGARVGAYFELLSMHDVAAILTDVCGQRVTYEKAFDVDEMLAKAKDPVARNVWSMCKYINEYPERAMAGGGVEVARELVPDYRGLKEYFEAHPLKVVDADGGGEGDKGRKEQA